MDLWPLSKLHKTLQNLAAYTTIKDLSRGSAGHFFLPISAHLGRGASARTADTAGNGWHRALSI